MKGQKTGQERRLFKIMLSLLFFGVFYIIARIVYARTSRPKDQYTFKYDYR